MKKLIVFFVSAIVLTKSYGQNVAINADASLPNNSAMLDVKSTNKGMLIPRVALTGTADVTTIPTPAISLMVYNTTAAGSGTTAVVPGYYYWSGSWVRMIAQKGGAVNYQDFYATMPPDNAATIPVFGGIPFPQTAISNSIITRTGSSVFILPDIATYEINFQVSVDEPVQLGISLNGVLLSSAVVGRAIGSSQIVGVFLINTTSVNTSLSIINIGNSAITLTPYAGGNFGANPVSAHLIIKKLN